MSPTEPLLRNHWSQLDTNRLLLHLRRTQNRTDRAYFAINDTNMSLAASWNDMFIRPLLQLRRSSTKVQAGVVSHKVLSSLTFEPFLVSSLLHRAHHLHSLIFVLPLLSAFSMTLLTFLLSMLFLVSFARSWIFIVKASISPNLAIVEELLSNIPI